VENLTYSYSGKDFIAHEIPAVEKP